MTEYGRREFEVAANLAARLFLAACLVSAGCNSPGAAPQEYPSMPIKLIVPFGAGGGSDTFARIMKKAVDDDGLLPQPLVIVNIDGAGATIGSRRVKNARPDGYTIMLLHEAILTAQASGTVAYGYEDFEPIAGTGEVGMLIAVKEDSPYADLRELMDDARRRPDEIRFGANMGALTHFAGLQLQAKSPGARFRFAQIGGGARRYSDLMGGHIDVTGFSTEEYLRFAPSGLRGLAYLGAERHPQALETPTARELGFDVVSSNTFYWWAPEGTPQERLDTLADALEIAVQSEYVRGKMDEIRCDPIFVRGEPLRQRLAASNAQFSMVDLPPPVGLPDIPLLVSCAVAALLIVVAVQWRAAAAPLKSAAPKNAAAGDEPSNQRTWLAIGCAASTAVYVLAMQTGLLSFRPATILFVLICGGLLARSQRRLWPVLGAIAIVLGFGLHYLFTEHFVVDLP